jgi:hypothetical protein
MVLEKINLKKINLEIKKIRTLLEDKKNIKNQDQLLKQLLKLTKEKEKILKVVKNKKRLKSVFDKN